MPGFVPLNCGYIPVTLGSSCGKKASCDAGGYAGKFVRNKAICTNSLARCPCNPTRQMCAAVKSCDDKPCAGRYDPGTNRAHCTCRFSGCACMPTAKTCGKP